MADNVVPLIGNGAPPGISDPRVEKQLTQEQEKMLYKQMLVEARMKLLQQMYAGVLTEVVDKEGNRRLNLIPPVKCMADDPYFSKLKFMGKPSGLTDSTGQPAVVPVTPKEAFEEMQKVLDANFKELDALDNGGVVLVK